MKEDLGEELKFYSGLLIIELFTRNSRLYHYDLLINIRILIVHDG